MLPGQATPSHLPPPVRCLSSQLEIALHQFLSYCTLFLSAVGWDGARGNFVNGYHDNRMTGGNTYNRGPPRMERGRGGMGAGGYRGNRGGAFNPINPAQSMGFGLYESKGADPV